MPDFRRLLKENRWALAMVVFTAVFYVCMTLPEWRSKRGPAGIETPAAVQTRLSKEDLNLREENFRKTLEARPRLFAFLVGG